MNIPSTLSNSYLNESSHLPPTHENQYESSIFSPITEQIYHTYPYNSNFIPILNYPAYSTNDYNISDDYILCQPPALPIICSQEPIVNTIKIHINPFFRSRLSNQTSESSSEIEKEQSIAIDHEQHNLSLSSQSRSRSSSSVREVLIPSNKKQQERQFRKQQREKFIQEKELIFKRQSSLLFSKSKHRRSSSDRWEHKEEKLNRLYKEYSNEDSYKEWKPLLLQECFELCQYAFDKYHETH